MNYDYYLSLGPPSSKISPLEIIDVGRMDGPIVSFAISAAASFDEAVVEAEVMADGVAPARASTTEVVIVCKNPLVYLAEHHLALRCAQDCHCNQPYVTVTRLWLVAHLRQN